MRSFGCIPESPRLVEDGFAMARLQDNGGAMLGWSHVEAFVAMLVGRVGYIVRGGDTRDVSFLRVLSRLFHTFLIFIVEQRGDRGLIGQGCGLSK